MLRIKIAFLLATTFYCGSRASTSTHTDTTEEAETSVARRCFFEVATNIATEGIELALGDDSFLRIISDINCNQPVRYRWNTSLHFHEIALKEQIGPVVYTIILKNAQDIIKKAIRANGYTAYMQTGCYTMLFDGLRADIPSNLIAHFERFVEDCFGYTSKSFGPAVPLAPLRAACRHAVLEAINTLTPEDIDAILDAE